jgi:hypothetical protein
LVKQRSCRSYTTCRKRGEKNPHGLTGKEGQNVFFLEIHIRAAFKERITGMNVVTKAYVQNDNLPELYPNEKGRGK